MTVRYKCRSCKTVMAEFPEESLEISLHLGALSPEERAEKVIEDEEGNKTVYLLCEYCQEAILNHPELSLLSSPLQ
ncbi:anti-sigma-F factor Fin [Thermicanus aegyptius]|uniref:anti-sigma-F factor Fin n=1 Tax=Thermicanus aegyptius TaxID=94009 RepID=UPI000411E796|nr:anti-sigma-F factor Fin [Thermicanus aegyptius]